MDEEKEKMKNYYLGKMEAVGIPEHMREGLTNYILDGVSAGGFLKAVIKNNLVDAYGTADHINGNCIRAYADFLYNGMPVMAWGSQEKYEKWINHGGMYGKK
jgi:hypothetical protein